MQNDDKTTKDKKPGNKTRTNEKLSLYGLPVEEVIGDLLKVKPKTNEEIKKATQIKNAKRNRS